MTSTGFKILDSKCKKCCGDCKCKIELFGNNNDMDLFGQCMSVTIPAGAIRLKICNQSFISIQYKQGDLPIQTLDKGCCIDQPKGIRPQYQIIVPQLGDNEDKRLLMYSLSISYPPGIEGEKSLNIIKEQLNLIDHV